MPHLRLALILCGQKLVEMGALDSPEDVVYFKYNEFRVFMGNPAGMDGKALVAGRRAEQDKAYTFRPKSWIGTCTPTQLAFPYLNLWGFPDSSTASPRRSKARSTASPPPPVSSKAPPRS